MDEQRWRWVACGLTKEAEEEGTVRTDTSLEFEFKLICYRLFLQVKLMTILMSWTFVFRVYKLTGLWLNV